MDKNNFSNLLQHPQRLSEESVEELNRIIRNHPYCQLPYFLLAKHYYQANAPEKDKFIRIASAYAPDRSVLKSFATSAYQEVSADPTELAEQAGEETITALEESAEGTIQPISDDSETTSEQTQEEILNGDEELKDETTASEGLFDDDVEEITPVTDTLSAPEEVSEEEVQPSVEQPESVKEIAEIENHVLENENSNNEISENDVEEDSSVQKETKSEITDDSFILGYLNKLKSDTVQKPNYLRKHQDDLIERFIKSRPSLTRPANSPQNENTEDLSEPSITIDENLISENLAIIMVKQGKIEKAIDIYKKLIWKYPQKKAYFANRIQELKK